MRHSTLPTPPAPAPTIVKKADVTGKYVTEKVPFASLFTVTGSTAADYTYTATPGASASINATTGEVTLNAAGNVAIKATHKTTPTVTATANITGVLALPTVVKKADVTGKALNDVVPVTDLFTMTGGLALFTITANNAATVASDGSTVTVKTIGVTTVTATAKKGTATATATITAA
jgi:hypothetical protein